MFNEAEFRAALARKGYTQEMLAKALGISTVTLWRKLNRDGDFTRKEINIMIEVLEIEKPEVIFFTPELTQNAR